MAFPHPQSGKENDGNENIPKHGGILLNFLRRPVNVTDDRKAKEDVNPAKYRALSAWVHDVVMCKFVLICGRAWRALTREQRLQPVEDLLVGGSAQGAHLCSDLGALKLLDPNQVCLVITRGQCYG